MTFLLYIELFHLKKCKCFIKYRGDNYLYMTKGDANEPNDRGIYEDVDINKRREWWIGKKHITGRILGFLPYVGYATILLNDNPMLKWAVLALMAIMVLTSRDPQDQ
jgi:signal peptidase